MVFIWTLVLFWLIDLLPKWPKTLSFLTFSLGLLLLGLDVFRRALAILVLLAGNLVTHTVDFFDVLYQSTTIALQAFKVVRQVLDNVVLMGLHGQICEISCNLT